MNNQVFKLVTLIISNKESLNDISVYYKDQIRDALENYTNSNSDYFKELKHRIHHKLGEQFAKKRDQIRWHNNYGYDCANEDITIFLAAYIKLSQEYNAWKANGEVGTEPFTVYKVYTNPDSDEKTLIQLTFPQMDEVYTLVRNSQLDSYIWLNTSREELDNITDWTSLTNFLNTHNIELEQLAQ